MYVTLHGRRIPRVLIGTSPFIGAGQFGERALEYFMKFRDPRVVARVIKAAYEVGVRGIQALPFEPITTALTLVSREIEDLVVVPSVLKEPDVWFFQDFNSPCMLIHASVSNTQEESLIGELMDCIREAGAIPGLVTHRPVKLLTWLREAKLKVEALMVPLNKEGIFMDGTPQQVVDLLRNFSGLVIAKKVLGAGRIPVREALEYIASVPLIDCVAIGVASEDEARETFSLALKLFSEERRKE